MVGCNHERDHRLLGNGQPCHVITERVISERWISRSHGVPGLESSRDYWGLIASVVVIWAYDDSAEA